MLSVMLLNLWERSGLNPVAQGQSPGADPAGYTVNTLIGAAQANYEGPLDNEATTFSRMAHFIRQLISKTFGEKVYLPASVAGRGGRAEWLALGPEQVDDSPVIVTTDPLSDANRLALRQSLTQAWKDGLIARSKVQREGFNVDDPEAMDDEIIEDTAIEKLVGLLIDNTLLEVRMDLAQTLPPAGAPAPGAPGGPGGPGGPGQPGADVGAVPAPANPPTVGSVGSIGDAPAGPRALPVSRARAGQGGGPPPAQPPTGPSG